MMITLHLEYIGFLNFNSLWFDPSMNNCTLLATEQSFQMHCYAMHAFLYCDTVASSNFSKTIVPYLIFLVSNLTNLLHKRDPSFFFFLFVAVVCSCAIAWPT